MDGVVIMEDLHGLVAIVKGDFVSLCLCDNMSFDAFSLHVVDVRERLYRFLGDVCLENIVFDFSLLFLQYNPPINSADLLFFCYFF